MSEFIDPDDLQVQRDAQGERLTETREIGSYGQAEIKPLAFGDVQEYLGDGSMAEIGPGVMAEIMNEFVERPSFDVTGDDVATMKPLAPAQIMTAILEISGVDADVDVDEGGNATVDVAGN